MSDPKAKAWAFFAFLVFGLPIAVFGIWGNFEKDKTIPQWLAERGWPSMKLIAGPYLVSAVVLSILFYLLLRRLEKPKLIGKIICLEAEPRLDRKDDDYDCFLTLSLEVRNKRTPTAVSTFSVEMLWGKESHPGTFEPLDGYYVQTRGREPGDERSIHAVRTKALTAFPYGEEITNTNYKRGWVRFSFGSLPSQMVESGKLAKEVMIELVAFDSQRKPHTIFKDKMYMGAARLIAGCGKIVKKEKTVGLSSAQITLLDMIDKGQSSFSPPRLLF